MGKPQKLLVILLSCLISLMLLTDADAQKKNSKKPAKTEQTSKSNPAGNNVNESGKSAPIEVIAKVGNENITFAELERAYKKNLNRKDINLRSISEDSLRDFLELYIKFKLKVLDAIDRGFDKDTSVIKDFKQNRRSLTESFYFDKKLTEANVEKLLEMRKRELQIAYILIQIMPVDNADTTKAYEKARKTLDLIKSGKYSFEQAAKDSSDDRQTGEMGGLLEQYITAGNTQRPIENAIYSLKPGQVYPELISTKYGYFILKLLKNEPRIKVKPSHILIARNPGQDSLAAIKKADSILALLKSGAAFDKLAEENSDDPQSAMHGGELGAWYSRSTGLEGTNRQLMPAFVEALFNLKDGQYSGKVITDYGIHIIRRDSTKAIDVESEREEVKKLYKRIYLEQDKNRLMDSIKRTYGFKVYFDVMQEMLSTMDTTKTTLDSTWFEKITPTMKSRVIYTSMNKDTKVGDFVQELKSNSDLRATPLTTDGFTRAINKLTDPEAFEKATVNIETEYPEFGILIKEFYDGILLFKVETLEVWDKLKFDSTLARAYYDSTKTRYKTQPKYDISEIYVTSDSLAQHIYSELKAGAEFSDLAEKFTQRTGFREKKGHWGKIGEKENKLAKIAADIHLKEGEYSTPQAYEKGFSIIRLNLFEPVRQKTFEEAIPDFAPAVQDILQKKLSDEWIAKLKKKYNITIFEQNLKMIRK